ncbi:hypothetical protein Ddye_000866 [Dipteronia dyeriana]|uniref:NAC domain-containing protein n=1 Tax=Dipteronia dyeriana TaxID=168575 RepID=A0AAE0CSY4_9ROSI|nr:hypothetical protein Ddye_000866 [Dipteronia dyeriana]
MAERRLEFVRENGVMRLPPGFRFQPTDEELVFQYLKSKIFSCSLPATVIPHINICRYDPWDLPHAGNMEQERYFFCNNEAKYRNGNRINRTTASGYWKATGVDRQIVSSSSRNNNNNQMVGMKKTLVFYRGKPPHESRTDWIMHEYRLVNAEGTTPSNSNWVICRIFLKKRSTIEDADHNGVVGQPGRIHDFMTRDNNIRLSPEISSCSSSSSSSAISEVSSNGFHHEESSSRNFF